MCRTIQTLLKDRMGINGRPEGCAPTIHLRMLCTSSIVGEILAVSCRLPLCRSSITCFPSVSWCILPCFNKHVTMRITGRPQGSPLHILPICYGGNIWDMIHLVQESLPENLCVSLIAIMQEHVPISSRHAQNTASLFLRYLNCAQLRWLFGRVCPQVFQLSPLTNLLSCRTMSTLFSGSARHNKKSH